VLIDMHAHAIPREFPPVGARAAGARWPRMEAAEGGARRLLPGGPGGGGLLSQPVCWDVAERRRAMQANGVDAEVVSPMPGLLGYAFSPADGLDLCRHVNEVIADLTQAESQRFFGLGSVPMQDPTLAAKELSNVKRQGLLGVEIASNVNGISLGDDRFVDFFEEAESQDLAIFVHGLAPTFGDRYPPSAGGGFGVAAEISIGAISLLASGIFDKCPNLRIALSHGAGGFPLMLTRAQFFWGRTWNEEQGADSVVGGVGAKPFETSPAAQARRFFYDSLVFDRRALRYLVDMLGARQLLIGTDHPFMERERPVGKTLRSLDLSESDVADITWNNCFRWLGTHPPLDTAPAARTGVTHG
jgi:aminocarboxymuconate-semialdehyde decarboxylase